MVIMVIMVMMVMVMMVMMVVTMTMIKTCFTPRSPLRWVRKYGDVHNHDDDGDYDDTGNADADGDDTCNTQSTAGCSAMQQWCIWLPHIDLPKPAMNDTASGKTGPAPTVRPAWFPKFTRPVNYTGHFSLGFLSKASNSPLYHCAQIAS